MVKTFGVSIILVCGMLNASEVSRIYVKDDTVPIQLSSLKLTCAVTSYEGNVKIYVLDTDNVPENIGVENACSATKCLFSSRRGALYTVHEDSIEISISTLNRTLHQKYWMCNGEYIYIQVYTVPQTLHLDRPPSQDQDLAVIPTTLRCITGCVYPQPNFTWFYEVIEGSRQEWITSVSVSSQKGTCSDSEKVYTSTLSLARHTTFAGNIEKTVKFICGVTSFPGMNQPLFTSQTVNVHFAVQVTAVTLKDGSGTPSEPLKVTSGVAKTLTCTTSVSRPTATVVWYIGTEEKQRSSTNFTFTPQNSDHYKQIYCKAFNLQPESKAVSSNNLTLYVQVQVTAVTLKDGSDTPSEPLTVTSGVAKTLTCTTSVSRPIATVVWYIGTEEKQRSYSSTSFTVTPLNSDHNKQIYCKAFNIQPESQAVSSYNVTLYVQVPATRPALTNWTTNNLELLENDTVSMECISSPTRPVAIVTWRKGSPILTNVHNTNITVDVSLVSVRSVVTFTPRRSDDNKNVYCETAIPGQQKRPTSQQRLTVFWPPSLPAIPVTDLPFLENQTGKTLSCLSNDYGNPGSEASWDSTYGTPDSSNSRLLRLPRLTPEMDKSKVLCQLGNYFTQAKGLQVKSPTISLIVQYPPRVQLLEDGKTVHTVTKYEGQSLQVSCHAVGNPVPIVRWVGQTAVSSELRFPSIHRSDSGSYTCRAEATPSKYLAHNFVSAKTLSLIVYYQDISFYFEGHKGYKNLTTQEYFETLKLTCSVDGRTPTSVRILFNGKVVNEKFNGTIVSVIRRKVTCLDGGVYTCEVYNNNGNASRKHCTLFVLCAPRPLYQMVQNITTFLYVPITLQFTALAYPPPGPQGFIWHKQNNFGWTRILSNVDLQISSSGLQTNLTILNVSIMDFGNYRLSITNNIDTYVQYFLLIKGQVQTSTSGLEITNSPKSSKDKDNTPVIIGTTLGILCVLLALYAVTITIFWKRKQAVKEIKAQEESSRQMTYVNLMFKHGTTDNQVMQQNQAATTIEAADGRPETHYTSLAQFSEDERKHYEVLESE